MSPLSPLKKRNLSRGKLTLDGLLIDLHHPQVRDLAWVIGSSNLVDQANLILARRYPQVDSITDEIKTEWDTLRLTSSLSPDREIVRCAEALCVLDQDPTPLLTALAEMSAQHTRVRLGVYFEHLVTYWLSDLVGAHPLYREIQIYEPQELGIKTVGALDLVGQLPDLSSNDHLKQWTHIEVATKFYLEREIGSIQQVSTTDLLDQTPLRCGLDHPWLDQLVGPNERDSLGTKLRRLLRHQLPLSARSITQTHLTEIGVPQVSQRLLWLKGRLFKWAGEPVDHLTRSLWVRIGQLELLSVHLGRSLRALHRPKPAWLAPPTRAEIHAAPLLTLVMLESQARLARGERGATLWYITSLSSNEERWVMIVPDDWCERDL